MTKSTPVENPAVRRAFLDGIAWMSEHTYLSDDGGYHVAEPSELAIRRAADTYSREHISAAAQ